MVWSDALTGVIAGTAAGTILVLLSHITPRIGAGNFIQQTDKSPRLFGKAISRREAQLIGLLTHLFLSALFGFLFVVGVEWGWLVGYQYGSMLLFVVALSLLTGLVIMPLERHGLFGRKHDAWFMADALITNVLWGHLFLVLAHLWMLR